MIVKQFKSREEWMSFRAGKIGGSSSYDVYSVKEPTTDDIKKVLDEAKVEYKKSAPKAELKALVPEDCADKIQERIEKKMGYYQMMAERLVIAVEAPEDETPLDRGTRLEQEAVETFAEVTKKKITNEEVIWVSDAHSSITYSPDGVVSEKEVAEAKCLSSALHLYVYFEKDIPVEYQRQNIQAFVVNEKLQTLHFVCYDPRIPSLPLHYITINRADIAGEIEAHKQHQLKVLEMLEQDIVSLTF